MSEDDFLTVTIAVVTIIIVAALVKAVLLATYVAIFWSVLCCARWIVRQ